MKKQLTVSVMGLGYIGLPTATLLASKGHNVIGVDVNDDTISKVNQGIVPISEPDLEGLLKAVVEKKQLIAQKQPTPSDVFVITVPTPFKGDHEPDLAYVESATQMIIPFLSPEATVILESTSPIGTTERLAEWIFEKRPELKGELAIAYCPERVLPGRILYELEHNDRVIGGIDDKSTEKARWFYSKMVKGQLHATTARTAEMCKLAENAYRDINIAYANELSMICDENGINVNELIHMTNKHPRVDILTPGPGVGGHCIAVDPWFLIHDNPEKAQLMRQARLVNREKTNWVKSKIQTTSKDWEDTHGRAANILCLGLTYKPDSDDLRESPAYDIASSLIHAQALTVRGVEPNCEQVEGVPLMTLDEGLDWANIVVVLVMHHQFKSLSINNDQRVLNMCGCDKLKISKKHTPKLNYVR